MLRMQKRDLDSKDVRTDVLNDKEKTDEPKYEG
jgi:hypothetical protein